MYKCSKPKTVNNAHKNGMTTYQPFIITPEKVFLKGPSNTSLLIRVTVNLCESELPDNIIWNYRGQIWHNKSSHTKQKRRKLEEFQHYIL